MSERQRLQQAINKRILPHVPSRAWESTVAIVVAHPPAVSQLGSGTLFQVADRHFLVTASHVIQVAHKHGKTIGIGATGHENLIPVAGNWICSTPKEGPGIDPHDPANADSFDVAVHLLSDETVAKLTSMRFLRIGDVYFGEPGPKAVYTLFGYPGVWSEPTRSSEERLLVKPLEFTTYAYDGNVAELRGYKPHLHLLLSAGPEYLTAPDGSEMEFKKRDGHSALLPRDLGGISGCSVWHIGDLGAPIERWSEPPPLVVGVETGTYHANGIIRASKWATVTTLIYRAFPDLQRSIDLWMP